MEAKVGLIRVMRWEGKKQGCEQEAKGYKGELRAEP